MPLSAAFEGYGLFERALQLLVPKILGLSWHRGQVAGLGEKVWLDDKIWLSADRFRSGKKT